MPHREPGPREVRSLYGGGIIADGRIVPHPRGVRARPPERDALICGGWGWCLNSAAAWRRIAINWRDFGKASHSLSRWRYRLSQARKQRPALP